MKTILLSFILALPITSFGSAISFNCNSVDFPGIHKFDAHGVVAVDDFNNVEGVVTVSTQKAEADQSIQTFEEVRVAGYIRHFKAGEVTQEAFDQLVLKADNSYIKTMNLLLDFDDKIASRIGAIDNFSYRSNCKALDTFN